MSTIAIIVIIYVGTVIGFLFFNHGAHRKGRGSGTATRNPRSRPSSTSTRRPGKCSSDDAK